MSASDMWFGIAEAEADDAPTSGLERAHTPRVARVSALPPDPPNIYDETDGGRRWAIFSACRNYRYALGRDWHDPEESWRWTLLVCGLNPSVAGVDDDHTIRKDVGFAKRLGCTALVKVNLYASISTDSDGLGGVAPVGRENDVVIANLVRDIIAAPGGVTTVAAWGSHEMATPRRIDKLVKLLPGPLMCLGVNRDGQPRHTCRTPYAMPLTKWVGP